MARTKVRNVDGSGETKATRTLEKYFDMVGPGGFYVWQDHILGPKSLEERKKMCWIAEPDILYLQKLFKKLTQAINEQSRERGFENYIKERMDWDLIPQERVDRLLEKGADEFIALVQDDIPAKAQKKHEEEGWNMLNTPLTIIGRIPESKFEMPDEVVSLISEYDPRMGEYKDRIEFDLEWDGLSSSTFFDKKEEVMKVRVRESPHDGVERVLTLVHELGHVLDQWERHERGEDPHKLLRFEQEVAASEFMHEFMKRNLTEQDYKDMRYLELLELVFTLFELDIYADDKQDYAKAFARATNRCYPQSNQEENPFYVLVQKFLTRPLCGLMRSIIETDLYLREAEEVE